MKKCITLCMMLLFTLMSIPILSLDLGDVNADRNVDIVDALLIAQVYVGLRVPDFYEDAADVNCSGEFDIVDALLIAQFYVGLLPELKCPEPLIPEISIIKPDSQEITSGTDPGYVLYGGEPETMVFTIHNTGNETLQLSTYPPVRISDEGTSHNCIAITQQPATIINSGDSTTFIVQFVPDSTLYTERKSLITIESNDPDEPVYEFSVIGYNIDTYVDYFDENPAVKDHTVNIFNTQTLNNFLAFISQLELNGSITIDEPVALQNAIPPEGPSTIYLTQDEHWAILGAKAAHAIWVDRNNLVPWKLGAYNPGDLVGLFANAELFRTISGAFYSVVDYSPTDVYGYMVENSLIGTTILETFHNVYDDLRSTDDKISFLHGSESYGDPTTVYSLYEAVTTYSDRGCKVARLGCQSMTRIMVGLLRSVNIPGTITTNGTWFLSGHSSAVWQCVQLVMPHGDDIYTATLRKTPTNEMLTPMSIYTDPSYTDVCGTDPYRIARRHTALRAFTYPDKWTISRCCDPEKYEYVDCLDYITREYGTVLTPAEIDAFVYIMTNNYCQ
ncbi:MAG: hypothetical protein JXJ04_26635 [Spirochaetales bacterium]|nr:hypothetical protein [Spirochaetales bacterium]